MVPARATFALRGTALETSGPPPGLRKTPLPRRALAAFDGIATPTSSGSPSSHPRPAAP
ncbi:MAG: hypothetical protein ACLSAH_21370 [Bilophila wadsworthia]